MLTNPALTHDRLDQNVGSHQARFSRARLPLALCGRNANHDARRPSHTSFLAADLNMSGTEIGFLNGLPIVLFAIAALPGSLVISRLGALPR